MNEESIAWVELAPEEDVREVLQTQGLYSDWVPRMTRLLLAHSEIGPKFRSLYSEIMRGPGNLSAEERQLVAAVAAAAQDCHY